MTTKYVKTLIIGGGMMGVGLAYHLAEEGWKDIVIVEKGELTSGSTWHAAGQCPSFAGDYNLSKLHHYSNTLYPRLEKMTGQYVSWHGCGALRLATTPEEVDWFKYVQGFSYTSGCHMEIISPQEAQKINPFLDITGVLAAAWTRDDGHVDPAGCCNALALAARNLGVHISKRNRVMDINKLPNGAWEVITEHGNYEAEHVVNAAGSYAPMIMHMVGCETPITNMEHQYLVTEPIQELIDYDKEIPVMRDTYTAGYYRQEQKAGLIGIYETQPVEAWANVNGLPQWDAENELFSEDIERISLWIERAMERMPIFANAGIKRVINGSIPHSPDGNPLLGPAPGLHNFWMCAGASIGIAQGAGAGKYLGQWMVHGDADINMAGFDPRRFGKYADKDYTREKSFQDYSYMFITHLPGDERPAGRPARCSSLFKKLNQKGAIHTEAFGWERPKWFSLTGEQEKTGFRRNNTHDIVAAECKAVRQNVGIMDLSSFAKFDVTGKDAAILLNRVYANKVSKKIGGIVLAHRLSTTGRIQSESTITKLSPEHYYILSGAAWEIRDYDAITQEIQSHEDVHIENISDTYGILVLVGPHSRKVMQAICNAPFDNASFPWLNAKTITINSHEVRALRVNYVGSLGWELHCPMDALPEIYDLIWQAGEAYNIADFGAYALNSMRMEKAYKGIGAELTNEITPVEADIMRFVRNKNYIGNEKVLHAKETGGQGRIIYCSLDATDSDARGGEPIFYKDKIVGLVTSGGYGHTSQMSLFFAYVQNEYAKIGTEFEIKILGEKHSARVLAECTYDPLNTELRA